MLELKVCLHAVGRLPNRKTSPTGGRKNWITEFKVAALRQRYSWKLTMLARATHYGMANNQTNILTQSQLVSTQDQSRTFKN